VRGPARHPPDRPPRHCSSPAVTARSELEARGHSDAETPPTTEPLAEKTQLTSSDRGRPRNAFAGPMVPLLVTAALLCGGGLAYAWMPARAKQRSAETASEVPAQSAPVASTLVLVDPQAPAPGSPVIVSPSASTSAWADAKATAPPAWTAPPRPPVHSTATVKTLLPPPARNCSPPYFFDSEGIKHPKKECM